MMREQIATLASFRSNEFTVCLSDYRHGLLQRWHSHEEPILILLLAGYTREQIRGRSLVAGPLDVGVKPAGIRHQDHFWPNGVRALRISFSAAMFTELERWSQIMKQWVWLKDSEAVRSLLRTALSLRNNSGRVEIEDDLYDSLASIMPKPDGPVSFDAPQWLRHAREHLETCYASGVRLTHLANEARVHPVYLARMFRRFFGCSVGEYVRKMQFRAAAVLINDQSKGLADIACQIGFSDQAHMTRAFASKYRITPGQFRRLIT